ncbi:phytoene desaturase family protein [Thalassobacillus hwangdonensis]|uniref:Phytoene desaturase family protein n=1 Tax=Thalassobacillus hwangdonensis TaxID=546108 RepID=A0ABW3KVP2_9BACI
MKVAVIGAGPGGLAAAMILAKEGYDVNVYEKQSFVGGRNGAWKIGPYTFDIGPTFLSMPHIFEEVFEAAGKDMHDYLSLIELDPMYALMFEGKKIPMYRDPDKMKETISKYYPGNERGYERFMEDNRKKMQALLPLLQNKHHRLTDYLRLRTLKALPNLSLGKTVYDVLSEYFSEEELKIAFTFQAKYLGMSPWECPGAFSILSYMEHEYGVYHPIGGLNQLSKAMATVVEELGGTIHLDSPVKKLITEGKRVAGLHLENGEQVEADEVIINADFAEAMTKLVDAPKLKTYSEEKLAKKKFSCSTFMIYIGVNRQFDEAHHTIVFSEDYKRNVEEITRKFELSEDPSIYIHNPSVSDTTLAPDGHSAIYILAPVPNNRSGINWSEQADTFKEMIYDTIEKKTGFEDLRASIVTEKVWTPSNWQQDFSVYEGATFSLGHQLSQMMYFRPHNKFNELEHCWLVGGGTHPGSGLPTILESARITTDWIMKSKREVVT